MGYKISYVPEASNRYPQVTKKRHVPWNKICIWVILLVFAFWTKENGIPDFLVPGDPELTRQAVKIMLDEMKQGEPIEDVVVVFCESILNGENA